MISISMQNMNDSVSVVRIDDVIYKIRMTYNPKSDYWNFGIYENDGTALVSAVKVVPNFPLFYQYSRDGLPTGWFICVSTDEKIGRYSFVDNRAVMCYVTAEDMERMRNV